MKGEGAEVRDSQRLMVAQLREWLARGTPALVEAPTGTGKSYAMLAVALDWLAADDRAQGVVSTFTKQLQSQLADDIEASPRACRSSPRGRPGQGVGEPASACAPALALAELADRTPRAPGRGRQDFTGDPRFRDLVLYPALRLSRRASRPRSGRPTRLTASTCRRSSRSTVPARDPRSCL